MESPKFQNDPEIYEEQIVLEPPNPEVNKRKQK